MPEVRQERTGWRCEAISRRHREWGYNCPCVDLDFMVAEYNYGKPVALIEYKEKHAGEPNIEHPTYKALIALADGYKHGAIPCAIVRYCTEKWWFEITPLNESAEKWCEGKQYIRIPEKRFVTGLYMLRKNILTIEDKKAIDKLNDSIE